MESKFDWFLAEFDSCSANEQIAMHNDYCDKNNYEDKIYSMYDFDDIFSDFTPKQIFDLVSNTENNPNDSYFIIKTYNGIETFDDIKEKVDTYVENIFEEEDIWQNYIDIDDYKDNVFDELSDLKPNWMEDDDFYNIVSNAVDEKEDISDIEYYVKNEIEREQEKLDTTMLKCRNNNY